MKKESKNGALTICLYGASFRTGNLGVSAIAEATVQCIARRWPDAKLNIIGPMPPDPPVETIKLQDGIVHIPVYKFYWPSKQLKHPDSLLSLAAYRLASVFLPSTWAKRDSQENKGRVLGPLLQSDLFLDSSSGDGLNDIYGTDRLVFQIVRKWVIIFFGKKLVLLPQTYGPIKSAFYRSIVMYIIRKSALAFFRDEESFKTVRRHIRASKSTNELLHIPDLAFVLRATPPERQPTIVDNFRGDGTSLVGINVSGLLFNEPKMHDFGLRVDYRETILSLMQGFLNDPNIKIVLVPHVLGRDYECDETACAAVMHELGNRYGDRILNLAGRYESASEAKYLIGGCDIFVGARMHACIAALSQFVPAVGLAYSSKFRGVFESVGVSDCVVNLRENSVNITHLAQKVFSQREKISNVLRDRVPKVQGKILSMFDNVTLPE